MKNLFQLAREAQALGLTLAAGDGSISLQEGAEVLIVGSIQNEDEVLMEIEKFIDGRNKERDDNDNR